MKTVQELRRQSLGNGTGIRASNVRRSAGATFSNNSQSTLDLGGWLGDALLLITARSFAVPIRPDVVPIYRVSAEDVAGLFEFATGQLGSELLKDLVVGRSLAFKWSVKEGKQYIGKGRARELDWILVLISDLPSTATGNLYPRLTILFPSDGNGNQVGTYKDDCLDCLLDGEKSTNRLCVCYNDCIPGPPCGSFGSCEPCAPRIVRENQALIDQILRTRQGGYTCPAPIDTIQIGAFLPLWVGR